MGAANLLLRTLLFLVLFRLHGLSTSPHRFRVPYCGLGSLARRQPSGSNSRPGERSADRPNQPRYGPCHPLLGHHHGEESQQVHTAKKPENHGQHPLGRRPFHAMSSPGRRTGPWSALTHHNRATLLPREWPPPPERAARWTCGATGPARRRARHSLPGAALTSILPILTVRPRKLRMFALLPHQLPRRENPVIYGVFVMSAEVADVCLVVPRKMIFMFLSRGRKEWAKHPQHPQNVQKGRV